MRKLFSILMSVSVLLGWGTPLFAQQNRMDFLLNTLRDGGKSDYVMIVAHRGDWRNAPENSLQAYQNCIDAGIDGIEVDVRLTKDSVLVMMHDATLDRTTTGKGKVSDYTLAELKQLRLRIANGIVSRQQIPTFDELLTMAKGKILIQVDKWGPVLKEVMEVVRKHDCANQIILRSGMLSERMKATIGKQIEGVNYIPVLSCKGEGDEEKLNDFMDNIDTSVIGISFKHDGFPVLQRTDEIQKRGFRIWYNSLNGVFNAGHDDELAASNPDAGYGWLLEKDANIIMTDSPFLLDGYLKKIGRR